MPIAKVDSRSYNFAKQADVYLRPVPQPTNTTGSPPPDSPDALAVNEGGVQIWRELSGSQDAVSSFIICLIAKLISLDSGQGLRPLPEVYMEITEMQVDISKYKQWMGKEKSLPASVKHKAVALQHSIVATIHFLKQFYGFSNSLQLRNMYLRWNLARNSTIEGGALADPFEIDVLTPFSVAASKDIIRDPLPVSLCPSTLTDEDKFVRDLIGDCCNSHRRSFFGSLPPDSCALTHHGSVATSLSYIRLKDLISRNPSLLLVGVNHICTTLSQDVSHTLEYRERESLLPLLQILQEFLTLVTDVDHEYVYKAVMPYYMWPSPHSDIVKKVLDLVKLESKVNGTTYRRKLLTEHNIGLKLRHYNPTPSSSVMLIDTSDVDGHGARLYQSLATSQEKPPPSLLKRLLLRSVLYSNHNDSNMEYTDMVNKILRLTDDQLTQYCEEGVDIAEQAVAMETDEEANEFLSTEISKLYSNIVATVDSEDQRDSAVSCTSDEPNSAHPHFPLPTPYMPVHELPQTTESHMTDKLKDIILRIQDEITTPPTITDSYPRSQSMPYASRTSLDSADSNTLDEGQDGRGLTSISEHWGGSENRSVSPTTISDPGVSLRIRKASATLPKNIHEFSYDRSSQHSSEDTTSDTGSSKTSDDRPSSDTRPRFERRHTLDPTLSTLSMPHLSVGRRNTLNRTPMSLYGGGPLVSPTSSIGGNIGGAAARVKMRANPSTMNTLRLPRRQQSNNTAILTSDSTKVRLLKIILAGDDSIVSSMAKVLAHLRVKEPNLFLNLNLEFYYVPLSRASSGWAGSQGFGTMSYEPPQPAVDEGREELGNDIYIGRYLGHMDSWYERNVMLAVHNTLKLIPDDCSAITRPFSPLESLDTRCVPLPTPSTVLLDIVSNYVREATHSVQAKVFKVKMTLKAEKSVRGFELRETFMLHKLDIQRLSGKKGSIQAKLYEASVILTELSLDNSFIKSDLVPMKDLWLIRASNIPHPGDLGIPNPENECFELTVMKGQSEGGKFTSQKYRITEESQHHVYELVVESKDKPLSVIIDGNTSSIVDNIIRIEVSPAYIDPGLVDTTLRQAERYQFQMHFPLKTFWPIDI